MSLKQQTYQLVKECVPPIILHGLKKTPLYPPLLRIQEYFLASKLRPTWQTVKSGPLAGVQIFSAGLGGFHEMLEGHYDNCFSDYLLKLNLSGKTVLDIGAHVGFSSLLFAKAVGPQGHVVAFEPNPYNIERFKLILSKNPELAKTITIEPVAVSDSSGEADFIFSTGVDEGTSSGSFVDKADTIWEKGIYEREIGFKRMRIKTLALDSLEPATAPTLVKIDVEGAEHLVVAGGQKFLAQHKPTILIEIHSIFNMFKVGELLNKLNYHSSLLAQEPDGRCFIVAEPR